MSDSQHTNPFNATSESDERRNTAYRTQQTTPAREASAQDQQATMAHDAQTSVQSPVQASARTSASSQQAAQSSNRPSPQPVGANGQASPYGRNQATAPAAGAGQQQRNSSQPFAQRGYDKPSGPRVTVAQPQGDYADANREAQYAQPAPGAYPNQQQQKQGQWGQPANWNAQEQRPAHPASASRPARTWQGIKLSIIGAIAVMALLCGLVGGLAGGLIAGAVSGNDTSVSTQNGMPQMGGGNGYGQSNGQSGSGTGSDSGSGTSGSDSSSSSQSDLNGTV
ncbi:MAG: hypothetical protein ABF453_01355 [Bifidobacterium psychraerophilum]|uniref:hypothetical protein n=1 Tax=Bifidobacterium psychraerophilum TaxID=218140 RepID=UPI0039EA5A7C